MINSYLGVDVGSLTTKIVLAAESGEVIEGLYLRTMGNPIQTIQGGLKSFSEKYSNDVKICGVGVTGSARNLIGVMLGADIVKNEITAHAVAALKIFPGVQTIIEIGGQDSKIIILRDGVVVDFAMNTVCAAGTGSFLDHQAQRVNIPIEKFGELALKARTPVRIAGRCAVFAESDMIHKQQLGHSIEDIVAGLCDALVRNYLNNVGKGKEILPPIVFQGGVAANIGIKVAFEQALKNEILIPQHHGVMGAIGCCYLARDTIKNGTTRFKGWEAADYTFKSTSFECKGCSNLCEVIQIFENDTLIARWGDRCGKWSNISIQMPKSVNL